IGTKTPKGYYRSQFESAWERYLPPEGGHDSQQRNNATAAGTSTPTQVATEDDVFRPVQSEKSNNDGHCSGVGTFAGGEAQKATNGGPPPLVCEHCGNPERPGNPVHPYNKGGQTYLLHPACWTEWLAGPDPDGWTFNLDDASP